MSELIGWGLVAASHLLLGITGYAAATSSRKGGKILLGVVSAIVLNGIASQLFTVVDLNRSREFGFIQEEQMQMDMPDLAAGLIMFGWMFFLGGFVVASQLKLARNELLGGQAAATSSDRMPYGTEEKLTAPSPRNAGPFWRGGAPTSRLDRSMRGSSRPARR